MPDMDAVRAALQAALAAVNEADGNALKARRAPPVPEEMPAGDPECEACQAGDCVEHLKDDDMAVLEGALP